MIVKVLDILHTSNGKGAYRQSKVGTKYEERKGKLYDVDFDFRTPWGGLEMGEVEDTRYALYTTEFDHVERLDNMIEIYTWNSIYVCEVVEE